MRIDGRHRVEGGLDATIQSRLFNILGSASAGSRVEEQDRNGQENQLSADRIHVVFPCVALKVGNHCAMGAAHLLLTVLL